MLQKKFVTGLTLSNVMSNYHEIVEWISFSLRKKYFIMLETESFKSYLLFGSDCLFKK